jgi:hypothetical protein
MILGYGSGRMFRNGKMYDSKQHNQIREYEIGWICSTHGRMRSKYRILVEKLKEGDILREIGVDGV